VPGNAPPIEQDVLPGDVACLGAAEKRASLPEFPRDRPKRPARIELGAFGQQLVDRDAALLGINLRDRARAGGQYRKVPAAGPLMVTLLITVLRAMPATNPVRNRRGRRWTIQAPRSAPFTAADVIVDNAAELARHHAVHRRLDQFDRPSACLASIALIQSSRVQLAENRPAAGRRHC